MGSLPTCWYCPECGNVSNIKPPGAHLNARTWLQCSGVHVESLVFPPDSPLTVILDTLGIPYQRAWDSSDRAPYPIWIPANDGDVLVVDNPATDGARPDWTMGVPPEQWPENSEAQDG